MYEYQNKTGERNSFGAYGKFLTHQTHICTVALIILIQIKVSKPKYSNYKYYD